MIRPVTLVTFLAFIGSGLYLYQVKHQAQLVDRRIRRAQDATEAAHARAQVLRAEYALLNDPDRLAELAAAYVTDLKPTQPGQWSSMAEIERRLPPVGAPTAEPAPLEPGAPAHPDAVPMPPTRAEPIPIATRADPARAEPSRPSARPAAALAVASEPAAAHVAAPAARSAPRRTTLAAHAQPAAPAPHSPPPAPLDPARAEASVAAPPIVQVAVAPLPAPRVAASLLPRVSPPPPTAPVGGSLLANVARPAQRPDIFVAPPATTAEAVARVARGGPVDPTVPAVASALGMARTMMAVTPVGSADAGTLYPRGTAR
jgi:hypothetical protein